MPSSRTYSKDEIAVILQKATEAQEQALRRLPDQQGLTLEELQEIGAEAGIAPEFIVRAAGRLDRPAPQASQQTLAGLPIGVRRTAILPAPLTDDAWGRLVAEVRATFDASGKVQQAGPLREWRNGNLKVILEPDGDTQRLRMQTVNANSRSLIGSGLVFTLFAAGLLAVWAFMGDSGLLAGPVFLAVMAAAMLGFAAFTLPSWSRTRAEQMEALAERATELAASGAASIDNPLAEVAQQQPAAPLSDTLDGAEAAPGRAAPPRTRTRS